MIDVYQKTVLGVFIVVLITSGYALGDKITDNEIKRHYFCTDKYIEFVYETMQSGKFKELDKEERHALGLQWATFWFNNCMDLSESIITEKVFLDRIDDYKSQQMQDSEKMN